MRSSHHVQHASVHSDLVLRTGPTLVLCTACLSVIGTLLAGARTNEMEGRVSCSGSFGVSEGSGSGKAGSGGGAGGGGGRRNVAARYSYTSRWVVVFLSTIFHLRTQRMIEIWISLGSSMTDPVLRTEWWHCRQRTTSPNLTRALRENSVAHEADAARCWTVLHITLHSASK